MIEKCSKNGCEAHDRARCGHNVLEQCLKSGRQNGRQSGRRTVVGGQIIPTVNLEIILYEDAIIY